MSEDAGYFWRRAHQELHAADSAANASARAAHLRMAGHYRRLATSVASLEQRLLGRRTSADGRG